MDRYAPNTFTGRLKHIRDDVLPYVYCCKGEFKEYTCDMYYKRRPSDDGSRFSLQPPGKNNKTFDVGSIVMIIMIESCRPCSD